jgi:AcrR family transcriptional regulator
MAAKTIHESSSRNSRAMLLDAAIKAFAELGYDGTSLRAIADRAGIGFQLIAYYFGTKDKLWLAAVEAAYNHFAVRAQDQELDPEGDVYRQYYDYLRYVIRLGLDRPQLRKIFVQEYLAGTRRYSDVLLPMMRTFYEKVALPYHEQAVRLGVIRKYTAKEAALMLGNLTLANFASSFQVEFCLDVTCGTEEYVDKEVDFMFRILTDRSPEDAALPEDRLAQRLEQLEIENRHLKQLVGEMTLQRKISAPGSPDSD